MRTKLFALAVAAAMSLPFCAAQAATATYDYTFTASGLPSGPSSVSGKFSLTIDSSLDYTEAGAAANKGDLSLTFDPGSPTFDSSQFSFVYDASSHKLTLGSLVSNGYIEGTANGENDFYLTIANFPGPGASLSTFTYSQGNNVSFSSTGGGVAQTPIPATLPLMGSALLALVGFGYFKSRKGNAAFALAAA